VRKSNVAEPTGVESPAEDTTYFDEGYAEDGYDAESAPSEYTTESAEAAAAPRAARRPVITGHAAGTGRRKEAIARVRIQPGTGQWKINDRSLEVYFPNKVHQQLIKAPLVTVDRVDSFDIYAHLDGGGPSGQAGALRLAIARALILVQPEDRPALKKAGFLTRDPRATERKKYGLKKARKAPQYSKR
jgi:small subunit ribosomal protein S9